MHKERDTQELFFLLTKYSRWFWIFENASRKILTQKKTFRNRNNKTVNSLITK